MKKVGIITMFTDYENFGNRLQNFGVQEVLKKHGLDPYTFIYVPKGGEIVGPNRNQDRLDCFKHFNDRFQYYKENLYADKMPSQDFAKDLDYLVIGSDQMWNFNFERYFSPRVFADFSNTHKKITFSVSIGLNHAPEKGTEDYKVFAENLPKMDYISVREDSAKDIIKEISGRSDVTVLLDPTMLLKREEWEAVMAKPKNLTAEKYIVKAFLGQCSEQKQQELERVAKEKNCEIIDIMNEDSPFFGIGPEEMIYLEKNAELVVTDSFHSSVFAIMFHTPFVIFERDDLRLKSMYSRIETLLRTFNMPERVFKDKIDDSFFNRNFDNVDGILEIKRKEADEFLDKAFND